MQSPFNPAKMLCFQTYPAKGSFIFGNEIWVSKLLGGGGGVSNVKPQQKALMLLPYVRV